MKCANCGQGRYAHPVSPELQCAEFRIPWPAPTPEMLETPEFKVIWSCIKAWDINVPDAYRGQCRATGNHVRAILDAIHMQRETL